MGLLSILQQECRQNESEEQKEQVFFASTFWTKLQNIFGHCCMSKLDKIATAWLPCIEQTNTAIADTI
jgi:hypothetical protein